jgi:hypothetical protein
VSKLIEANEKNDHAEHKPSFNANGINLRPVDQSQADTITKKTRLIKPKVEIIVSDDISSFK